MTTNETCSHCDGTGMVPELYGQPCGCQGTPMTTNDATAREARERIAKAIHAYTEVGPFRREWDSLHWADSNTYQGQADAVIDHLWRAADDPGVIHQLAGAIGGGGPNSMDSYNSDHISAAYRAREILLSIIIGPRPQGENDGQ